MSEWDQRPGERNEAHTALMDYLRMGAGRSLAKLTARYEAMVERGQSAGDPGAELPPTRRKATLEAWSTRYGWQARAEAWDKAQEAAVREQWAKRQQEIRERDWGQGSELRTLGDKILGEAPNFIKRVRRQVQSGRPAVLDASGKIIDPGEPAREVVTLALDIQALIKSVETGSKLQRMAAGMPDSHQETTVSITADDLARARDKAQQCEEELLGGSSGLE